MSTSENEMHTGYKFRINGVFQFIDENLDANLSLSLISQTAFFSPFHFHRIFKTITGETLKSYVTRRRVEKSASDLLHRATPISEIALKYGFNDNSSFSRAFRKFYGQSPTAFRRQHAYKFSKIRQLESKNGQEYPDHEKYICAIDNLKQWTQMNAKIEIREMPGMELAYVSSLGSQNIEKAYQKLLKWATPRGLITEKARMVTIYHDSFKVTAASKVRISACIVLPEKTETGTEISKTTLEAGKSIVGRYEIGLEDFEKSWTGLFIWMNDNGYKKADREPFEIYHNDFNHHPEKKCIVDLCIPIE